MADPRTFFDYPADADKISNGFPIAFDYLEDEHVTVEVDGVENTNIELTTSTPIKVKVLSGVTAGQNVRVRRKSQPDTNLVDFVNGSVLTESELDRAYLHNRYLAEEIAELNEASLQLEQGGTQWDAKGLRIKNVGTPTATEDATNKTYVDNKVNQVSNGTPYPPTKWVFTGNAGANTTYTVTGAEINGDTAYDLSIDGVVKEPTTDYTVDPDTDVLTIIPSLSGGENIVVIQRGFGVAITSTVVESNIIDGAVTTNKLGNGAVTTAKIEDSAVTTVKTDFDQLTIEADTVSEGQGGIAALEIVGVSGSLIDLRQDPEGDFDVRLINQTQSTRLDSKDPVLIRAGASLNTALNVHTDGKVQVGSAATPSYALDVAGDVNVTGNFKVNGTNITTAVPTGTVSAFAGSAAPTGYALCDGSAVNRTTEAALFAVIGTTYGIGDGSTTFNLPDLRGRVVAGLDSANNVLNETTSIDGTALGEVGGDDVHLLTDDESGLPAHSHTIPIQFSSGGNTPRDGGTGTDTQTKSTGTTGGDDAASAHNNVQPTIILNYIIKT